MEAKYIAATLLIAVVILFFIGGIVGEQCTTIGSRKACWKSVDITSESDLCPSSEPCRQQPYLQQYNSIIDALILACEDAKANSYSDAKLNEDIRSVINDLMDYTLTAQEACEQSGTLFVKRAYE